MAKADYTAADRTIESLTAGEKVQETVFENPDAENRDEAYAEGVLDASFIGYEDALEALEDRPDMESFDAYTRRSYGVTGASFDAGKHMRELPNRSGGNGYANDPDNAIVDPNASGSDAS